MKQILFSGSIATFIGSGCAYADAVRYVCEFPTFAQPGGIERADDFIMEFTHDTLTNDAFLTGNAGVSPIVPVVGDRGITFLEILSSGTVQSTTIAANSAAVHSRHTIIENDLVPSQYYGNCQKF